MVIPTLIFQRILSSIDVFINPYGNKVSNLPLISHSINSCKTLVFSFFGPPMSITDQDLWYNLLTSMFYAHAVSQNAFLLKVATCGFKLPLISAALPWVTTAAIESKYSARKLLQCSKKEQQILCNRFVFVSLSRNILQRKTFVLHIHVYVCLNRFQSKSTTQNPLI